MATTYTLISSNVLASNAASVTFSSIPSTYTDLKVVWSARTSNAGNFDGLQVSFNGTSSVYSSIILIGKYANNTVTSTVYASENPMWSNGNIMIDSATNTASTFGSGELYLPNYTSSANKPASAISVCETNSTSSLTGFITDVANLIRITSAITSMTFTSANAANFVTGSSFYLYGIKSS